MRKIKVKSGVVEAIALELETPTFNVEAALAGDERADCCKEIRAIALVKYGGMLIATCNREKAITRRDR